MEEKQIKYDDFDKVELKVAKVTNYKRVKGADRLLQFRLGTGDENHRQIPSGITEFYPDPTALTDKKVVTVANLKPRKMRDQISQGIILSTEPPEGKLQIAEALKEMPDGAGIA